MMRANRRTAIAVVVAAAVIGLACAPDFDTGPTGTGPNGSGPANTDPSGSGPSGTGPGGSDPTGSLPTVEVPRFVDENGFDDHTVPRVDTVEQLLALSRGGVGEQQVIKFTIPAFDQAVGSPGLPRVHLMDSNFYSLHDEWYWFRLMNGQRVPGSDTPPVAGQTFATVADIYQWALRQPPDSLPLDLQFTASADRRLYSSEFYDLALDREPRTLGVGAIVRMPNSDPTQPHHWLLELEYSDEVTAEHIAQFFARLGDVLPDEVTASMRWVIRSPQHDAVAQQMIATGAPYADRIVYFADLVPAGTVAVYSEGVTAGRLLYVDSSGDATPTDRAASFGDAREGDIIITERAPDWLPQAAALITSDPQTPLAHVNLLARNRGIPNASMVGVHLDPGVRQAARVRGYALIIARGDTLQIALITKDQYEEWQALQVAPPTAVAATPTDSMPMIVDLTDVVDDLSDGERGPTAADIDRWRPIIGGKSAGFISLIDAARQPGSGITPPPDPLAITIRPYVEHLEDIRPLIAGAINDAALRDSPRARYLTLEGLDGYSDIFPTEADASFADSFFAAHPRGTALGEVLAAGGVRAMIESRPIDPDTLQDIVDELSFVYRNYDIEAGLRFRSSSSVEDIEGFNGAGLYTSYTGYLRPELLEDPDDRDNTIERALLRGWSSYWSFEAFEERRLERIDHLSGAMGLTVHARFDDDLELNNGVATFTYLPVPSGSAGGPSDDAVLEVNVQVGSTAVTNPDPTASDLPEVVRVRRVSGRVSIERVGESTLADGEPVLDDDALLELFAQTEVVASRWRSRVNDGLPVAQRLSVVVLDFEFKTMAEGWPRLSTGGDPLPQRLVLRQVRSLDPGLRGVPDSAAALPIPRDVLQRASLVQVVRCTAESGAVVEQLRVTTDPLRAPDMGYANEPLVIGTATAAGATCSTQTLLATADQYLLGLVDSGAFVIVGD